MTGFHLKPTMYAHLHVVVGGPRYPYPPIMATENRISARQREERMTREDEANCLPTPNLT